MEAAIPRAAASRLPGRIRLDARAAWIWALTAGLMLYLGIDGGGYDVVVRSDAGVVVWWILLVGAALSVLPASRLSVAAWIAVALLGGFVIWSAIASTWSLSSERSLEEVSRLACYLGVLVLAVVSYGDRRRALGHAVAAVAAAVVLIMVLALLSRLRPGTFSGASTTASFLPGAHGRLSWPLNYWNALAAMVALGLPLLLCIATSARTLAAQAAAAGAIPLTALCGYLTFSRGGAIATAAALAAFMLLASERIPKLASLLVSAAGSAVLIAGAVHRHAIEQGLTTAAARHEGATLLLAVVLVCAGVAIAQVGIGLAARHGTLPRLLQISPARARALLAVAVVAGVVAALALGAPGRVSHAWQQFKQPNAANLHQEAIGRYGAISGNGRYSYWQAAVNAMPGHWLGGSGPGTFQLLWLPRAPFWSYVRNAHSLYIETLAEVGIVGLVLLVGFLFMLVGTAIHRVMRSRFESRTQAAAVAAASIAFLVSAAFDWVWQVPVLPVALLLLGAGVLAPRAAGAATGNAAAGAAAGAALVGEASHGRRVWAVRGGIIAAALACLIATGVPLAATNSLRQSQAASSAGNTTAALADARTAIGLEPGAASPELQAALVLELQRRFGSAVADARAATADEPANWQTWLVRSRLEAEAGHPSLALAAYRRARKLNPASPVFHS